MPVSFAKQIFNSVWQVPTEGISGLTVDLDLTNWHTGDGRTLYNSSTLHFPGPYFLVNVKYIKVEPDFTPMRTEGSEMFCARYQSCAECR